MAPRRAGSIRTTEVKGDEVLLHGKALEDRTIGRPAGSSIVLDEDPFPFIDRWTRYYSVHKHGFRFTLIVFK